MPARHYDKLTDEQLRAEIEEARAAHLPPSKLKPMLDEWVKRQARTRSYSPLVSRTTHELAKAKETVLLAATELQSDPTNMVKYTALVSAINDLERDRNTVQGAMLKAFANPSNPQTSTALAAALPHILFNPAVRKAIEED